MRNKNIELRLVLEEVEVLQQLPTGGDSAFVLKALENSYSMTEEASFILEVGRDHREIIGEASLECGGCIGGLEREIERPGLVEAEGGSLQAEEAAEKVEELWSAGSQGGLSVDERE